jgi:hypothetical protein
MTKDEVRQLVIMTAIASAVTAVTSAVVAVVVTKVSEKYQKGREEYQEAREQDMAMQHALVQAAQSQLVGYPPMCRPMMRRW